MKEVDNIEKYVGKSLKVGLTVWQESLIQQKPFIGGGALNVRDVTTRAFRSISQKITKRSEAK